MNTALPAILAGPMLRHVDRHQITLWLVTKQAYTLEFNLYDELDKAPLFNQILTKNECQQVQIGQRAFINLINITIDAALPQNHKLYYDLLLHDDDPQSIAQLVENITYPGEKLPSFEVNLSINAMLHGSCRKPHFDGEDGLCRVDQLLESKITHNEARPSMLMMSGDQVYVDDVAGPTLVAIHQVIELLGLFDESWQGTIDNASQMLYQSEYCYYQRQLLLPHNAVNKAVYDKIFAASKKPIFTSVNAKNHLVTLAEVFAMYLLVWSPDLWAFVNFSQHKVKAQYLAIYQQEQKIIENFVRGLPKVRRALAHLPVYMVFDDHDVTDDWNLTRGWEEAAYNHPFSLQIIGNALVAYYFCQGWGNAPEKFTEFHETINQHFTSEGYQNHDELITLLFTWEDWHYTLHTSPKVIVLDTRTRRWRSESNAGKPSGLMDWEALSELQQELINQPNVIMVSPAPVYGVKLIEAVQRVFTFLGQPLMVDAENWMAHPGTANVMLNIFRHKKTPPNFIILSGDVHYSFVYEVTHRFIRNSSQILQITCSGIKNQFPTKLLSWFEKLNRYLYASYSPLNWFTKRRRMKIKVRRPQIPNNPKSRTTLFNKSGIGLLELSDDKRTVKTSILVAEGNEVCFVSSKVED